MTARGTKQPRSTLQEGGDVKLPTSVRRKLGLRTGDEVRFQVTGPDEVVLNVVRKVDAATYIKSLPPLPTDYVSQDIDADIAKAQDLALSERFKHFRGVP